MLKILVIATLAGTILAQSTTSTTSSTSGTLAPLPQCAQICLGDALSHEGACSSIDAKCLCENMDYDNALSCCIATKCNPADQQTALAFNTHQCAAVNVTIPNTVGCNGVSSSTRGFSTSATVEGAISVATTAVATFTGGKIFTGSCTSPQFASVTLGSGQGLEYPWQGCSNQDPGCCPFDIKVGGALSVCPADYITTQGGCCPSGWSVHTSALAGEIPCVTTPASALVAPTAVPSAGASVSVITAQIFSLKYTLSSQPSASKLASGAIAGIAVGGFIVILLIIAATFIIIRKRRAKAQSERNAATVKSPTATTFDDRFSQNLSPVTELPSPAYQSSAQDRPMPPLWNQQPIMPAQPLGGAELPAGTPPESPRVELLGCTHINEHHPANSPLRSNPTRENIPSPNDSRRDTVATEGEEGEGEGDNTPIYSPIGGSALLPDSPHLNREFNRESVGDFPDSPRSGSVRERVEELEKGHGSL